MTFALLRSESTCDTITNDDKVVISKKELEIRHGYLLAEIQHLRKLLGLRPLPTGSQQREGQYRYP